MKKNKVALSGRTQKEPVKKVGTKLRLSKADSSQVAANEEAARKIPPDKRPKPFPIVGFGASAGGLKAFITILEHLDSDLGMAYVLIMHLSPNHKSALTEILQLKTKMQVQTVKDGMEVMMNNIYVIPPNTFMSLVDGHLKLAPRSSTSIGNFAVDYFLTALASIYKNNAIGVILSGTASDGTLGLKAIKAEGGITFAQESAEFSGMPDNAFNSGSVDFLLPPEGIAHELALLVKMPYTILPSEKIEENQEKEINEHAEELKKILVQVRNKRGVDFFLNYKHASVYRRVLRRMVLNKFEKLEEYGELLKTNPKEIDALYDDFLINVTQFFRDPEFYKTLVNTVFPSMVKQGKSIDIIRIWIAGCASGEEAYSVAICLFDFLEQEGITRPIQIFATDLDSNAIEEARLGIYPTSALQGVSEIYLKKYFKKLNGHYQIVKSVREVCIFSQHNLLKDPPFSRISLISCQNVLIYLETSPQRRILQTFHYSLAPSGYLFLGKSETIGSSIDLFEPIDKKIRIFTRKPAKSTHLDFSGQVSTNGFSKNLHPAHHHVEVDVEEDMNKLMLSRFVHPSVVVNRSLKIVQFFGLTAPYLSPVSGKASFDILKMIREDLTVDLRSLLQEAAKTERVIHKEGIRIKNKKELQELAIEVVPKKISGELFFLVVFKERAVIEPLQNGVPVKRSNDQKDKTILKLEDELSHSRVLIRSTNEEYQTTYEELQANNEEILSSNEELQSVNEELETSKEELQSANEELTTTNLEFQKRNTELQESQKELKRVNEQLEQFAFVSSHDLQEPLRKIQTFSALLLSPEADLNNYAKNYSSRINMSAARMSSLIKDLLSYSILARSERKLVKVDLNEVLRNVVDEFELILEEKKAIIKFSALPIVEAEPVQMTQLFHNLISNALKFSKENPVIIVSAREVTGEDLVNHPELGTTERQYVVIDVDDNGIGFDQKYVDKIFMLFQRLPDGVPHEGTGIGLSICKKIVEDHNGFIFASGTPMVGAVFSIFLPC